jgi:hypothetical protein
VHYTLSAVSVQEIPLDKNDEIFVKLTEREGCQRVIDRLLQEGEFVCQGQSVLLATVEYQLTAKASAAGNATIAPENAPSIKAALEAAVNAKIEFDQGRFISGTGLHYGKGKSDLCNAADRPRLAPAPEEQFRPPRQFRSARHPGLVIAAFFAFETTGISSPSRHPRGLDIAWQRAKRG